MKVYYGNWIIIATAFITNGMLDNFYNLVNGSRSQEFDQRKANKIQKEINVGNSKETSSDHRLENRMTNGVQFAYKDCSLYKRD